MTQMNDRILVTLGWWGYLTCAVIYTIAGIRAGDWLGLSGSIFFLLATIVFLIHHYRQGHSASEGETKE